MASEGNLSNYSRQPRGILVVDRSLRAIEKGVFTAPVRIASGGRFDVAVAVDDPKVRQCFEVSLPKATNSADPKGPTQWLASPVTRTLTASPSTPVMLSFHVTDSQKMPVTKGRVQILAFEPPGRWQERQWAEIGPEGTVDATQVFPHAGHYVVQLLGFESGVQLQSAAMLVDVASQEGGK